MKKRIAYLLPAICLVMLSALAKADTLQFNSVGGSGDNGPYNLTLDSSTSLQGFCMNDKNYIQSGESWTVNVVNGSQLTGPLAKQYEEEAFIYSHLTSSNANDIQAALWKIFDPSEHIDSAAQALVNASMNFNNVFYKNGSLDNYSFYLYAGGPITKQYENYDPQNFIGKASPTPEPSSLMLFGSGLVGLAGVVRRKLARA